MVWRPKADGRGFGGLPPMAPGGAAKRRGIRRFILTKMAGHQPAIFVEYTRVELVTYRLRTYRSNQLS